MEELTLAAKKKNKRKMKAGDFFFFVLVMGLVIFGVIMVFSASYYTSISETGNPYAYLKSDLMWAVLGLIVMLFLIVFDYRIYYRFAPWILGISLFLLVLLLIPHVGLERNGAVRWLGVEGFPITIMPGEFAKIFAIIFVAWFLAKDPSRIRSFKRGILPLMALCGVYFALIIKQPNLSTALTICMIIVGIMFVAGLRWIYLGGMAGLGIAGILFMILTDKEGYRMKRLLSFQDPFADPQGTGWQVIQSLYALGTGGLTGVGLGKSIQKTLYLPEPQNDFIFAIIGEELGYVGCLLLILAYVVLIWRCIHIALNAPDMFSMLLASGITIMIGVQVLMNIAVATSSMPPTGVTLPFVSYGGNALLLFMGSAGIMLNISRHSSV